MDQPAAPDRETTDSRFEGVAPPRPELPVVEISVSEIPAPETASLGAINARRAQLENAELLRQLRSL